MIPFALLLTGYLLLPVAYWLLESMGPVGVVSAVSALLVGLSVTSLGYCFARRRFFIYSLPLTALSLFHLGTIIFLKHI